LLSQQQQENDSDYTENKLSIANKTINDDLKIELEVKLKEIKMYKNDKQKLKEKYTSSLNQSELIVFDLQEKLSLTNSVRQSENKQDFESEIYHKNETHKQKNDNSLVKTKKRGLKDTTNISKSGKSENFEIIFEETSFDYSPGDDKIKDPDYINTPVLVEYHKQKRVSFLFKFFSTGFILFIFKSSSNKMSACKSLSYKPKRSSLKHDGRNTKDDKNNEKNYSSSLIIFLATIRFIRFITFNKTLTYLVITFKKCAFDLIGLSVTTIIVLAACSIILNLQYGTKHFDYTTITGSLASLFRMFWGDFKYTELHNQEPLFTILLHLFYIYFVYFFLINMILVIIIDTYAYVKSHETNQSSKLHLLEFLRVFIMINLKKCFITEWILSNIFEKLSIKLYCVEDVERELRKRGFNEKEIECMYNKYCLEISNQIDEYLVKDIILWMMESTEKLFDHKFINEKKIKHLKKFCPDRLFLVFKK
jgi:hypothetical protein